METHKNKQMLTVGEVAKIFSVKEATVREWAKKGSLPARKIGRNWYFHKQTILGLQGERDALEILGGNSRKSANRKYDIIYNDKKIEVKSSRLLKTNVRGHYWQFSNFREESDYYFLLGYDSSRENLLVVFYISTLELKEYVEKYSSKSSLREPSFFIKMNDDFWNQYSFRRSL